MNGSGSPFCDSVFGNDDVAPLQTGVPTSGMCTVCRKVGCTDSHTEAAPAPAPAPATGVAGVRSLLNASTASVGSSAAAGASTDGSNVDRYIVTRRLGQVHVLNDSSNAEMKTNYAPDILSEVFGYSDAGVQLDVSRALVANLNVMVHNQCDYGVVISVPGFAEEACTIPTAHGGVVKGAVFCGPRSERSVAVLRDPEIVEEARSPAYRRHTRESLSKYKHVMPSLGVEYHDAASPVFDRLMAQRTLGADRIQEIMSKRQLADTNSRILHTIDSAMYDAVEQEMLNESAVASASSQDLTKFQYVIRRADGLAFDAVPAHIEGISSSVTRDVHAQQFSEMPGVVTVEFTVEYASDAV